MTTKKQSFFKKFAATAAAIITLVSGTIAVTNPMLTVQSSAASTASSGMTVTLPLPSNRSYNVSVLGKYSRGDYHDNYISEYILGTGKGGDSYSLMDIMAEKNTPIYAIADGTVYNVKTDTVGGNKIVIKHNDGSFSYYGHMISPPTLKVGAKVKCGQQIGNVGMSGTGASGYHLHFEWSGHDPYCEFKNKGYSLSIKSSSGASAYPHDHNTYYTAKVKGTDGTLMINSRAKSGYAISSIPEGASCKVYPDRSYGNWLYVEYNGKSGYSYKTYLVKVSIAETYYVSGTDGSLNINSKASSGYKIGSIPEGAACTVDTSKSVGNWVWTTYNGKSGYCYKTYLVKTPPTNNKSYRVKGTDGRLMINSKASSGYAIGSIPENAVCTVNKSKSIGNWWYVTYNGVSGYSYSSYLKAV